MARPIKGTTFWDRVYSHTEKVGDCLMFTGCRNHDGYGRISRGKRLVFVHREVWAEKNGPIPPGKVIPEHLILGTQVENIKDMDRKGRRTALAGSQSPKAKLTETDVSDIRVLLSYGVSSYEIARLYGVIGENILHVKHGRSWVHV